MYDSIPVLRTVSERGTRGRDLAEGEAELAAVLTANEVVVAAVAASVAVVEAAGTTAAEEEQEDEEEGERERERRRGVLNSGWNVNE